jgi:rod shape-determining protein MreC
MINDQSSGVGVLLEKSRLQGVLRGTPDGELNVERVMSDEQVTTGETVLSSGGDQIFPKGLPVGKVSEVGPGREMFLSVKVNPAADLSRLEEVLVVTEKQERGAVAESGTKERAADILARRLPSVPDKPAVAAGSVPAGDAAAKSQPNNADKPANASVTKLGGKAATAPSAAGSATVAGQPSTGEVLKKEVPKKVVQKPVSGDSDTNGGTGSAALTGSTGDASNGTSSGAPSSANSPAKPATAHPKPAAPQPAPQTSPQPPATEDSPH